MGIDLPPLHEDLLFNAPLSPERARKLAAFAGAGAGHVLDVGCGWGELLLSTLEVSLTARGTGVDTDARALSHARQSAAERSLSDRVDFIDGAGAQVSPRPVDAVLCIGSRHVWGADDATALTALRARVSRGAQVVYGDGIWSAPPNPAATEPFGGDPAEYGTLADVVEAAQRAGFRVIDVAEATQAEWDSFESGYSAGYEHWLLDHADDDPAAAAVRREADEHRAGYLRGYRGVLGHCFLQLVAA
jgi:predicted RNA methylase